MSDNITLTDIGYVEDGIFKLERHCRQTEQHINELFLRIEDICEKLSDIEARVDNIEIELGLRDDE